MVYVQGNKDEVSTITHVIDSQKQEDSTGERTLLRKLSKYQTCYSRLVLIIHSMPELRLAYGLDKREANHYEVIINDEGERKKT